jgi:hypothetical protein
MLFDGFRGLLVTIDVTVLAVVAVLGFLGIKLR